MYCILGVSISLRAIIFQALKFQQRRDNTALRARIHPKIIPNASVADQFIPAPRQETGGTSTNLFRRDFTLLTS